MKSSAIIMSLVDYGGSLALENNSSGTRKRDGKDEDVDGKSGASDK